MAGRYTTRFVNARKQIVIVPNHREIEPGTLVSTISQAGMTKEAFPELL